MQKRKRFRDTRLLCKNPLSSIFPLNANIPAMSSDNNLFNLNDMKLVCRYCVDTKNDITSLRSLLFRSVKIDGKSWQANSMKSDRMLPRLRWKMTQVIEGYLAGLSPSLDRYSKQMIIVAHAIEYFLFLSAPESSKYEDVHQLRRRSLQIITFMAQRIRFRQQKKLRERKDSTKANHRRGGFERSLILDDKIACTQVTSCGREHGNQVTCK